eukprot:jgi/Chrzof1/11177/Cz05g27010.t1
MHRGHHSISHRALRLMQQTGAVSGDDISNNNTGAVAAVGGRQLIVDDPREEVTDVTYPFSAVGAILGSKSEVVGSYTCSGALIAPDLVLTAGHCVYETQSYSDVKVFVPGLHLDSGGRMQKPFGSVRIK